MPRKASIIAKYKAKRGEDAGRVREDAAQGAEKGAVARILAGVDEGKISKEKAAEMVKALNKSSEKEDPVLKSLLEGYWKADLSIRGGYATRIEMYLQSKASGERGGQQQRPAQDRARELSDEDK